MSHTSDFHRSAHVHCRTAKVAQQAHVAAQEPGSPLFRLLLVHKIHIEQHPVLEKLLRDYFRRLLEVSHRYRLQGLLSVAQGQSLLLTLFSGLPPLPHFNLVSSLQVDLKAVWLIVGRTLVALSRRADEATGGRPLGTHQDS